MTGQTVDLAVMFADVAGSTRLYERLGDVDAEKAIGACLSTMTNVAQRHGGTLIKTIGDEIMVRFDRADASIAAACDIQECLEIAPTTQGVRIAVHIGIAYGPAVMRDGDVFGDAVNVAARMEGIAKATQIITTEKTIKALSREWQDKARQFDVTHVRGKEETMTIYEVVWENEDVTRIVGQDFSQSLTQDAVLQLRYGSFETKVVSNPPPNYTIGRGSQTDLAVSTKLASRVHAKVEYRRGKFVIVDQSTNGTFVRTQDGESVYLRREELLLWGAGVISLGEEVGEDTTHLIYYVCP